MPLQQIRPDFSGSAESMQQAQRGIQQVGTFANDWMDRLTAEQKEATRQKELQAEKEYRAGRDVVADTQAKALLGIQQAAEGRAVTEDAMKKATRQAYGKFGEQATAPNQTQAQMEALLKPNTPLGRAMAEGRVMTDQEAALINKQIETDIQKNKGSLDQQRQLLLEQGPVSKLWDVVKDPVTGQEVVQTREDIDTTAQQAYKQSLLDNLDKKISDRDRLASEWSMLKFKEAGDNARLGRTLKAQQDKAAKFEPVRMTYFLDKSGKVSENPTGNPIIVDVKSQSQMDQLARTTGVFDSKGRLVGMKAIQGDWKGSVKPAVAKTVYGSKAASALDLDLIGRGDTSRALAWANATLAANPSLSEDQAVGIIQQALDKNMLNDEVSKTSLNAVLKGAGLKTLK